MHAIERFWRKVDIRGQDECWPWMASIRGGYPAFWYGGRTFNGHRIALFSFGPLLYVPEIKACHACDNRLCCNTNHLFIATQAGNRLDRDLKGRGADHRGEAHGRAKLTEVEVIEIRERYPAGNISQSELGREYGVYQTLISGVVNRQRWAHVA